MADSSENCSQEFQNALGRFPVSEFLATEQGINELENAVPEYFGLIITQKKINLGTYVNDSLPLADMADIAQAKFIEDMGSKISEDHHSQAKVYRKQLPRILSKSLATEIKLNYQKSMLETATILGYTVFPKKMDGENRLNEPQISVLVDDNDKELAIDGPIEIASMNRNDGVKLKVQIRIPNGAYKGFIGKWVVIALRGKWKIAGRCHLQVTESTFIIAVKVSACIVDEDSSLIPDGANGVMRRNNLSVEARVFVPTVSLNYFDNLVPNFGDHEINTVDGCTMFQVCAAVPVVYR